MRLAHCMTYVRDLDRSIRFYEALLGYRVADRHRYPGHRLAYLRKGDEPFEIELIAADESPLPVERPTAPTWHLAFAVDDIDREFARVRALGCPVDPIGDYRANDRFMTRFFYAYDPDGNQIEFLESVGRYDLSNGSTSAGSRNAT